jgi:hypothetical protein
MVTFSITSAFVSGNPNEERTIIFGAHYQMYLPLMFTDLGILICIRKTLFERHRYIWEDVFKLTLKK